ncbi:MAG: hypothetical protein PVH88_26710 [Ignavibacteria bacterium]
MSSLLLLSGTFPGGSENTYKIAATDDLIELSNTSGDWDAYFMETAHICFSADETRVDQVSDGIGDHDSSIPLNYKTFTGTGRDFVPGDTNETDDYRNMDKPGTVNNGYPVLGW